MTTAEDVKALILSFLEPSLVAHGLPPKAVTDDTDLRAAGLIDSFGFVRLLGELERRLGGSIDLGSVDPDALTNIGVLSRHIAAQHAAS